MQTNLKLRQAIKLALLTGASTAGVGAISLAHAQGAPAADQIEEITVTGSRIVRKDFETSSPVMTLDAKSIIDSGTPQIEQVLNELPQLVPTITTTSNNPSNGGQANIDLRGLGTGRTLVLVDGGRVQPSTVSGTIDLNTIPAGLIESVEIVTGGGSAVYGSDAIAGVVNIKMKRNFEGVQLSALTSTTAEGDGVTNGINLLMGGNFEGGRGNAVLYMSWDDRESVFAGDRAFSIAALGPTLQPLGSTTTPEGYYVASGNNPATQAAYDSVFGAGAVPNSSWVGFNADGSVFSRTGTVGYTGDTSDPGFNPADYTYNYSPVNYLQLPLERRQVAAYLTYGMSESVELYGRMTYTQYEASQELAATPVSSGVGSTMLPTNPFIPADLATILASRTNPASSFTFAKRTLEVGSRNGTNNYDVFQTSLGARGEFDLGEYEWNWDAMWGYGRTQRSEVQTGNVSRSRLATGYSATAANPDPLGCGGLDPFGRGAMSAECAAAIAIRAQNTTILENDYAMATVTGGLFELPAGTVQTALGLEYRKSKAEFRPDEFLASGDVVGFNAQQPVAGSIDVTEGFVEFVVPLLQDAPGAQYLGLDAAYRRSDYNLAGGVNTYMAGLEYEPVDSVKLRASYNRAIAAPNVNQLFRPQSESFPAYTDPCWNGSAQRSGADAAQVNALCAAQGAPTNFPQGNSQVRALLGGNPDLDPESADTYTVGVVWTPEFGDNGLRLALDYFKYEIEDRIGGVGAASIVSRCFNDQGANPSYDANNIWCGFFTRDANGIATDVQSIDQNLGKMNLDGIDVQADYATDVGPGTLGVNLALTYLMSWQQQEDPAAPLTNQEGTIGILVAETFPEIKARLTLGYEMDKWEVRWTMNYIDGMDVVNSDAGRTAVVNGIVPTVDSYTYHRLTGTWMPTDKLSLTLGIANMFDKEPPIYTSDSRAGIQANTDPSTYDVLGRRYFLTGTYSF
ncbi:MAG: TonB-dependent receptor [Gammaproteobacteria bacterium]|nr:TonB-dependent receptor [Gammaproteobacteria bacterium]